MTSILHLVDHDRDKFLQLQASGWCNWPLFVLINCFFFFILIKVLKSFVYNAYIHFVVGLFCIISEFYKVIPDLLP